MLSLPQTDYTALPRYSERFSQKQPATLSLPSQVLEHREDLKGIAWRKQRPVEPYSAANCPTKAIAHGARVGAGGQTL